MKSNAEVHAGKLGALRAHFTTGATRPYSVRRNAESTRSAACGVRSVLGLPPVEST